jgi:hypothetical protein
VARVVLALAAIGVVAIIFARSEVEQRSMDPTVDGEDDSEHMKGLRAEWGRNMCDTRASVELGEALLRDEDYAVALELVDRYTKECEVDRRVLWVALSAHKRLEQWEAAFAIADRLVTERPTDINYWWWRAQLREQLGQPAGAAADYRQSFANRPNDAASRGLESLRRCQSAYAWTILVLIDPDEHGRARPNATDPFDRPACAALIGAGGTSLDFDEQTDALLATATVGGAELRAVVDPRVGTSVIARSALAQTGVAPGADAISTRLGDAVVTGPSALLPVVDLQGAKARQVGVVVTDAIPGEVDLVLGIDFVWRFTRHDMEHGMLLASWDAESPAPEEAAP